MKTSTEATSLSRASSLFSQLARIKKKRARASLTVARLCRVSTPVSLRFSQDHEEKRFPPRSTGSILLYFFSLFISFSPPFDTLLVLVLSQDDSPPLAPTPARTVFAKLSGAAAAAAAAVDNKRYASHTDSREILNTVAHLRRVHGGKETGRPDLAGSAAAGPRGDPAERRSAANTASGGATGRKGGHARRERVVPLSLAALFFLLLLLRRRIYRGEIRRFIEAVRGS